MKNVIAGYRVMAGLTQKEMAELFNVSKQTYWSKEVGRSSFSDKEKVIFLEEVRKVVPNIRIDDIFFTSKVGK